jgi:hypothetical protein
MHGPGAHENFADELDMISALLLKWHARLSGNIERAMTREPMALDRAVADAWRETAEQMPGVRLVIDRCIEFPAGPEMQAALDRACRREWVRLAMAAGVASAAGPAAVEAGRRIEEMARAELDIPTAVPSGEPSEDVTAAAEAARHEQANASLVERIKAVLAA